MNTKGIYAILFCEMPTGQSVFGISSDASAKPPTARSCEYDGGNRPGIRYLDAPPAVDVCSYNNEDLDALGLTIDQLATALELIANHDHVIVLDGDTTTTSASAVRRILGHARPIGTSTDAWQTLTAAAAQTLATAKRS